MLIYNLNQSSEVFFFVCLSVLQLCIIDFYLTGLTRVGDEFIPLFLTPTAHF